jgi:sugar O-acyltransferase (sialic acid O-acetyltransferase NeuD family)
LFSKEISQLMENPVIIFGAKGLGKVAYDIFTANEVVVYCFLDDDRRLHGSLIGEAQVSSHTEDDGYLKYIGQKCEAFIATDDTRVRKALVKMLLQRRKIVPVNCIHTNAVIENSANIGHGNLIAANAVISSVAQLGNHCTLGIGAVVEHEAQVGDFVQIGTNAVVGAGSQVGEGAFIGAGAVLVAGVKVGKNASVGAGSLVAQDVADGQTVFGVPAQVVGKTSKAAIEPDEDDDDDNWQENF